MQTKITLANSPTFLSKPDDESGAAEAGAVTETKEERVKIAERDWINDAGEVVDEDVATGVRYKFLGRTKNGKTDNASGKAHTVYFRDLSAAATGMFAGFGMLTLMGNLTNTWMNEKGERAAYPEDAIAERFALIQDAKWVDRSGGVGAKIDEDALAEAVVLAVEAAGKSIGKANVRQRIADTISDPKGEARTWYRDPRIAVHYNKLVGREAKGLDTLLAGI